MTQYPKSHARDDASERHYVQHLRQLDAYPHWSVKLALYPAEIPVLIEYQVRDAACWGEQMTVSGFMGWEEIKARQRAEDRVNELAAASDCDPLVIAEIYRRVGEELVPPMVMYPETHALSGARLRWGRPDGDSTEGSARGTGSLRTGRAPHQPYMAYLDLAGSVPGEQIIMEVSAPELCVLLEFHVERLVRLSLGARDGADPDARRGGHRDQAIERIRELLHAGGLDFRVEQELFRVHNEALVNNGSVVSAV